MRISLSRLGHRELPSLQQDLLLRRDPTAEHLVFNLHSIGLDDLQRGKIEGLDGAVQGRLLDLMNKENPRILVLSGCGANTPLLLGFLIGLNEIMEQVGLAKFDAVLGTSGGAYLQLQLLTLDFLPEKVVSIYGKKLKQLVGNF